VRSDIGFWRQRVDRGGLICGHDYNDSWPNVKAAVLDAFGGEAFVAPDTSIWFQVL